MESGSDFEGLFREIYRRERRIVGWGTGSVFRYFLGRLPVEPEYLVDNDASKWGMEVMGIPVYGPDRLKEEDPGDVAIIIYSSFLEQISEQIRTLGGYEYLAAGVLSGREEMNLFLCKMADSKEREGTRQPGKSGKAVVIQGPLLSSFNIEIVRYYSMTHPSDYVILSTWEATNPLFLKELEGVVDEMILNTPPDFNGYQNRNYQLVSTLAGVEKARELGMRQVLKTRTDVALLSENILEACESLRSLYGAERAREHGLRGRIIVPETYTRKYMLYHPGDLVMYGDVEDMLKFWSTRQDSRVFGLTDVGWRDKNIREISEAGGPVESYLGRAFAGAIGLELNNTLEDYWDYLRDFFIVVDNSWFDIFWTKYPRLSTLETQNSVLSTISHCFWHKLYFGELDKERELGLVDIEETRWADFYEKLEKVC